MCVWYQPNGPFHSFSALSPEGELALAGPGLGKESGAASKVPMG